MRYVLCKKEETFLLIFLELIYCLIQLEICIGTYD